MRHEMYHNSPEQVRDYLRAALGLVDELDPPEDLRVALFGNAVTMLAAKQITVEQVGVGIPNMAIPRGRG